MTVAFAYKNTKTNLAFYLNKKQTEDNFSYMFLHVIQNGFEYLIEKGVVDIDITLFRELINSKVDSLEPIRNLD